MMGLLHRLANWFKRDNDPQGPQGLGAPDLLRKLLTMLDNTEEIELSCDDVYQLIDQFAEKEARGEDAARVMPLIQQHLNLCNDCREEYDALMRILEAYPV